MAAAGTTSVDSMLADAISKMDALAKRMDALETGEGSKNPITKGDDDDDKRKDDTANSRPDDDDDDKKDDATTPKSKILDDAQGTSSKADAGTVPPPHLKGDSKKKSDDGELEIKHKGKEVETDSKKKADAKSKKSDDDDDDRRDDDDDDDRKNSAKAKSDDDDDDDRKDSAAKKADAVAGLQRQLADQAATISRLQALMKPRSDDEHAAFADAQAKADAIFSGFGKHAPRPMEGEDLLDYRKRLATTLKTHSPRWKTSKLNGLPDDVFSNIEGQIYDDAAMAAANPIDLAAGELRMVTKIDPSTGVRSNIFYGKESFVKKLGRPGRRVQAFNTRSSI